jgi:hypothetical protein
MIKYSDVYVSILAKGLLQPGEQFLGACAVSHQPFWSLGMPFFRHSYLLVATSHRLVAVDHRKGLVYDRLDRADSYAWGDVTALKLSGVFTKKIAVKDRSGRTVVKGKVGGFLGPMPNNAAAARTLAQTWEHQRRLSAPPMQQALPQYAVA